MSDVATRDEGIVDAAVGWFLLRGSRWAVAGVALVPLAVLLGWMATAELLVLTDSEPLPFLFSAIVGGNFTLLTVVLSVNQLVLSRQLKAPGEVRSRIEEVHDYRDEVEADAPRGVAPVLPPEFFLLLLETARRRAQELGGLVTGRGPDRLETDVEELVDAMTALDTNYAVQIRDARRIKREHDSALSEGTDERIDDLIDSLEHVDVARQYLRTLYVQDELARFSRMLLYVGLPAMFVPVCVLVAFTALPAVGATSPALRPVVAAAAVVGLTPLAVLFSFVLRVATVSQRTIAITPFTMAHQESDGRSGRTTGASTEPREPA